MLRGASRYEPRALFRTYLYRIALNLLSVERRKAGRETGMAGLAHEPPVAGDPDTGLWVRRALGRLDAEHREVLMLREYEQLNYAEIADLLGVPVNTVRSRLFRARMALKDLLVSRT